MTVTGGAGPQQQVLAAVEFDPKLRTYFFLQAVLISVLMLVGLVLLPFALWFCWWWSGRYVRSLSCTLTPKRLLAGSGIWFRKERAIPLDKIQDVSLIRGPVLDALGLVKLRVETAGSGGGNQGAAADLIGVRDAVAFQEMVLDQRDREADRLAPQAEPAAAGRVAAVAPADGATLGDILAVLKRIEAKLPG